MKKVYFMIIFFTVSLLMIKINTIAEADKSLFNQGKQSWLQHNYQTAYEKLGLYRLQPYGQTAEVDYMLGTSGCRLEGLIHWGYTFLDRILYVYSSSLSNRDKEIILKQRNICFKIYHARENITSLNSIENLDNITAGAIVTGGYFQKIPGFFPNQPLSVFPIQQIISVDQDELTSRIILLGKNIEAMQKTQKNLPNFNIYITKQFIIASDKVFSTQEIDRFDQVLTNYLNFLVREYHMLTPINYITIYFTSNYYYNFINLALKLHGLYLIEGIAGYSYPIDQSIAIFTNIKQYGYGNLLHELFHLAVRGNFGDIPQWLDEGIASLYEEFNINESRFIGLPNWRGDIIKENPNKIPTLKELIKVDWFDKKFVGKNGVELPIYLAIARYFTLYMQDLGILSKVYRRFSDQSRIFISKTDSRNEAIRRIESAFHKKITEIQVDFDTWLSKSTK